MDYWIVKLNKNGNIQWQKTYGGLYADILGSIEQTKDGGYILGGSSNSPQSGDKDDDNRGIGDFWIIKINNKGVIEWQKTCGGNEDEELYAIHQTQDGGYIVGGNSNSNDSLTSVGGKVNSGSDYWIFKMDANGTIVWSKTYDFGPIDILTTLLENKDSTYLVGGYSAPSPKSGDNSKTSKDEEGINDYIVLKIDEQGEILWKETVGSDGEDILKRLVATRDGSYLIAGTSNAQSNTNTNHKVGKDNKKGKENGQFQNSINGANTITDPSTRLNRLTKGKYTDVTDAISDTSNKANNAVNDKISSVKNTISNVSNKVNSSITDAQDAINDVVNLDDLGVELDATAPLDALSQSFFGPANGGADAETSKTANEKKLPASRDKRSSYGSNDFWVVKIKDKSKTKASETTIEAFPNPDGADM